jgi:acyl-CoA synthetase (AMP-forming)/AMP-acid ligase II
MAILDVLAERAASRGARPFLRHEGQTLSYRAFDAATNRAAHSLLARGVRPGDRVTLALGNSIDYVVAAFAVLKVGAILNPVNPTLGADELAYILGHAQPRVVVTDAASDAKMRGLGRHTALGTMLGAGEPDAPVAVRVGPDDFSTLLYTSGTTGRPKGVLFTHGRTGTSGPHFIEALGLTGDDTILAVTPLFHGNAWGSVVTALYAGGTAAFPKTFSGSQFWPLVHEVGATVLYTLGTVLAMLLTREPTDLERQNPLRIVLGLGSAPIRDRILERFGVHDVLECFGSTDAGVVTITPRGAARRAGSCGPAVPGVRLEVVGDDGRVLGPREVGEIAVESPARMACYYQDDVATREALHDGWFMTGDLGYLDEDGWLYFVDRKRDVIRRGGENVSSVLVEKVLCEHPNVVEVAVVGIPDPVLGQEIKAYVVPSGPVGEDELRAFAAERLAKFQVPRLWEFRDSLPKTPTQRVEKYKLRQEHERGKPLLG